MRTLENGHVYRELKKKILENPTLSLNCQELYRIIGKYFIGRENYYAVILNASKNNNK